MELNSWFERKSASRNARCYQNRMTGELLELESVSDRILHLRATRNAEFSGRRSNLLRPDFPPTGAVPASSILPVPGGTETDSDCFLAGEWRIFFGKNGNLRFYREDGTLLFEENRFSPREYEPQAIMRPVRSSGGESRTVSTIDGEKRRIEMECKFDRNGWSIRWNLHFSPEEALYGLGQHENVFLNYRGRSEYLFQQNMKVAMPILLSTRGYGILLNTEGLCAFHDDHCGSGFHLDAGDELDLYLIYGPEFDAIVSGIRFLTGPARPLPLWACGFWQSRERYENAAQLLEVAHEYRSRKLPVDVIVQDWKYWPEGQWGQKSFDVSRYPDPCGMCDELHRLNLRLIVSIWPNMNGGGENQLQLLSRGEMLGNDSTYDAFNPEARACYYRQMKSGLLDFGVDGLWCDCTEPFENDWHGAVRPEPCEQLAADVVEAKKFLPADQINSYSLLHSKGLYEHFRADFPDRRLVNLTRSGSPGSQRYGAIVWSGDVSAEYRTLRRQIASGLNFTVCGAPKWSCDIGGFFVDHRPEYWFWRGEYPQGIADPAYRTLFVRWFQFGVFLPVFRAHGTDTPRELWQFGKPGESHYDALVKALRLRYRLLPYLYSNMLAESIADYTSFRLLAFDFRQDRNVYDVADQFLCGSSLLVAPIVSECRRRTVYLPEGASWYAFSTGELYEGGKTIEVEAALDEIPIFVRAGSIVPTCESEIEYAEQMLNEPVTLHIYGGADARYVLYADSGDGNDWEDGNYDAWECVYDDARSTLAVNRIRRMRRPDRRSELPLPAFVIHRAGGITDFGVLEAFDREQLIL